MWNFFFISKRWVEKNTKSSKAPYHRADCLLNRQVISIKFYFQAPKKMCFIHCQKNFLYVRSTCASNENGFFSLVPRETRSFFITIKSVFLFGHQQLHWRTSDFERRWWHRRHQKQNRYRFRSLMQIRLKLVERCYTAKTFGCYHFNGVIFFIQFFKYKHTYLHTK